MKKLAVSFLLLLTLSPKAAEVTLSWDVPVSTPAITNFAVYTSTQLITNRATVLRTNTISSTNAITLTGLPWSTTLNFVAASREGTNESPTTSNPTTYTTPALPAPTNLRIGP
jgi:hypothetical protein